MRGLLCGQRRIPAPARGQNRREKALKCTMRVCGWAIPARLRQKVREKKSGSISLQSADELTVNAGRQRPVYEPASQ
jgi:hypothetical protein